MSWKRKALKTMLWAGALVILLSGVISFYFYFQKDKVINAVIHQLNDQLAVPIDVYKVDVSFRHFPRLSVLFTQVRCTESKAQNPELLLNIEKLYIKFSLLDVVYGRYYINEIGLENGYAHIKFFEDGSNNFSIFKSDTSSTTSPIDIEKFYLTNVQLTFSDFKEKIFTSQQVFSAEISTSFRDSIRAKGNWNAQNIYVRIPDFLFEEQVMHNTFFDYLAGGESFSIALEKASLDKLRFDFDYRHNRNGDKLSVVIQNQKIFSNTSLQKIFMKYLPDYRVKNDLISAKVTGERINKNWMFSSTFEVYAQQVLWGQISAQIDEVKAKGIAHISERGFEVKLSEVSARSESSEVSGILNISGRNTTEIEGNLALHGEPDGLARLAGMHPNIRGRGIINAGIQFKYTIDERPKQNKSLVLPEKFDCTLRSDRLDLQIDDNNVLIPALNLSIDKQGFDLRQQIAVNGRLVNVDLQVKGLASWLVDSAAMIDLRGNLSIDKYDEQFWKTSSETASSPLALLDRTRLDVQLEVGQYAVNLLRCHDMRVQVRKSEKDIELRQLSMNLFGGVLEFDGNLKPSAVGYTLQGRSQLRRIDLSQLMLGFNDFEQQTLTHKNLQGKLTGNVQLSLPLAADLEPDVRNVSAEMDLRVQNGRLLDFEPLEALGRFVDIDELKDVRFDELTNRLKIQNQLIQIPQFEIRSNALNLILEGTHSFDNVIDYKVGLGLSDVLYQKRKRSRSLSDLVFEEDDNGARVWIRIVGTTDQPKISPIRAELVRSRNQLFTKPKEEPTDSTQPGKPSKSPFKFEWDEN